MQGDFSDSQATAASAANLGHPHIPHQLFYSKGMNIAIPSRLNYETEFVEGLPV
jgi:hypothetical protein